MIFHVNDVKKTIPDDVTVVAATKYFTTEQMRQLYREGIHDFGENRDNAFLEKYEVLKDLDITWHFIGSLQTKKVKKVIHKISYLHSLDSMKLAEEIDKRRTAPLKCFLQVNISHEESKHGFTPQEVLSVLPALQRLKNIEIIGFMGMAEYTDDVTVIHREFQVLNDLQQQVQTQLNITINELSIGMSNDYLIALEHDATFLRLGSVLFSKEV
ncbi:YggS family pyridoxal phosphate-dependent enzyme [Candidatus Xianfuyuplasma coldseepsis]|uniref:Pyridoxal phosphate homeostasis protein n=1 Tax=Candidatus Xianfuyuplasma coldseepsis TaxID=2782163 RepID=A0A7L7KSP7_9MOLU|nr:YggS family pyridoxal phosphate-dependent enzyme [Xianfuyuplasma coldseepsis]QMS85841.1 YggS family pyridoxal phosphate-dependent enzyme [Xianfuyuplasma coldseepsis]